MYSCNPKYNQLYVVKTLVQLSDLRFSATKIMKIGNIG